jgi:hypothetical protein
MKRTASERSRARGACTQNQTTTCERVFEYAHAITFPAIRLRRGDEVEMTVKNALDIDTTVHWHGPPFRQENDTADQESDKDGPAGCAARYPISLIMRGFIPIRVLARRARYSARDHAALSRIPMPLWSPLLGFTLKAGKRLASLSVLDIVKRCQDQIK